MDDSKKTLQYLEAVEKLAEEILSDKREIVLLDKRRNGNREALRALQRSGNEKCWMTVGANVIKCPVAQSLKFIEDDQIQLEVEINKLRNDLKLKVNKLRDLEHQPPVPGLMLVPLSLEETKAFTVI